MLIALSREQHVAGTAYGAQELAGMAIVDLAAQSLHIHFDGIREGIKTLVPDMLGNLGPSHDLIDVAGQKIQERVFLARKLNRAPRTQRRSRVRIDYQIATSGIAARAEAASIYKVQRFSDHAPLSIDYRDY